MNYDPLSKEEAPSVQLKLTNCMSHQVFIERSRLGKRIYELRDSSLTISGIRQFKKFEKTIPLGFTSPNYVRARRRLHYLVQVPIAKVCVGLLVLRVFSFLPTGPYVYVAEIAGILIGVSLWQAILGIPPIEIVMFKNTNGRAQFDLVKEKKQAKEFEEFVAKLASTIRGETGPASTGMLVSTAQDDEVSKPPSYFCISSLVVGSLWLEISHLEFWARFGGSDSFVGFLISLLGAGLCLASFVRVEKLRFWSLVGAALTLVPCIVK